MISNNREAKMMGHGWTRIHADRKRLDFIRVNPCPSAAKIPTHIRYNQPFCRAMRAASVRFAAPNLLIASER